MNDLEEDTDLSNAERRRYFRVDDIVIMSLRALDSREMDAELESFEDRRESYCLMNSIQHKREQFLPERRLINKKHPEIGRYLEYLESHIESLSRMISASQEQEDAVKRKVNLSAQGIRFMSGERFEADSLIELRLVLHPSYQRLLVIGTVIWCDVQSDVRPGEDYCLAVDFTYIDEADREVLIKHVHNKQMQNIHKK